jgi:hypothetical protein
MDLTIKNKFAITPFVDKINFAKLPSQLEKLWCFFSYCNLETTNAFQLGVYVSGFSIETREIVNIRKQL